jgi:hypothetical protein
MAESFVKIYSSIVAITMEGDALSNPQGYGKTLRQVTGYVESVSPSAQLTPSQKTSIRELLDRRIAEVCDNKSARIERFKRLHMYRAAIGALDPPRIGLAAESHGSSYIRGALLSMGT